MLDESAGMSDYSILLIGADPSAASKVEAALRLGRAGDLSWVHKETLFDGLRSLQDNAFDLVISGAGELFRESIDFLQFPSGDARALARHVYRLASDADLRA